MSLSRLLPAPARAFPAGWHDRLIKAAIHPDAAVAQAHADAWLRANDIDNAPLRDHRLLVEIASRFGPRLDSHAAYPRLVGLRRMLWTRSRMALREALPALRGMADGGVEMLLFKGSARLADTGDGEIRSLVHDVDIAVAPRRMLQAFDTLVAHGWRPAHSVSHHHVRERLTSMRAVRMARAHVGDIHLHAAPFGPGQGGAVDDAALWRRSRHASLDGIGVLVPAPEDGLALAIAHGGLDAHAPGDWLVDAAELLSREGVNWAEFEAIVEARALGAPALFALAYLSAEAGLPVPPAVLARMEAAARGRPMQYLAGFARARPDYRATLADIAIRGATRLLRKRAARRLSPSAPDRWLAARRTTGAGPGGQPVLEQSVGVPAGLGPGPAHFHAVVQVDAPAVRRRIEFEINSAGRHICRVRYRGGGFGGRLLSLVIDGPVDIAPGETGLTLVARPGRVLRHGGPRQKARYDALPFRCIRLEITGDESRGGG